MISIMSNYYKQSIKEIEQNLKTSARGLSANEVLARRRKYGANTLPKKKKMVF